MATKLSTLISSILHISISHWYTFCDVGLRLSNACRRNLGTNWTSSVHGAVYRLYEYFPDCSGSNGLADTFCWDSGVRIIFNIYIFKVQSFDYNLIPLIENCLIDL